MSVASVQHSNHREALGDFTSSYYCHEPTILTIEEIRSQLYSCYTCGVCWLQDHVCLDCSECGGYSLQRPCPQCDGQCPSQWKRDLTMSHGCGKARWNGTCSLQTSGTSTPHQQDRIPTCDLNKDKSRP